MKLKNYKRIERSQLTDDFTKLIVIATIIKALRDLHTELVTLEDAPNYIKDKEKWLEDKNLEIEYNKNTAKKFFRGNLFKATGINYNYLIYRYRKHGLGYNKVFEDLK